MKRPIRSVKCFQFEGVARFQLQFLSKGLGNDDAASLVDNQTGIHIGIII